MVEVDGREGAGKMRASSAPPRRGFRPKGTKDGRGRAR